MSAIIDRNFLFGMLAVESELIDRDQLLEGLQQWLQQPECTLGQILVARGVLDARSHQALDRLVEERMETHGGSVEETLAFVRPVSTDLQAELSSLGGGQLADTVALLPSFTTPDATLSLSPTEEHATQSAGKSTSDGRFAILRLHAKGGLGEVFVARDSELNREVALKRIRESHAENAESQHRFLLEAEITGRLEHPNIVPVYGLGYYKDSRPYYAMRLIRGVSLEKHLRDFYDQDRPPFSSHSERTFAFRKLLGHFLDVCQAVEYAHSRGIIHRDLKPANIMLGKYGETLLVDWGLAKSIDQRDDGDQADSTAGEATLVPALSDGVSPRTAMGGVLGTPAFMSPEQAAGRLDQVDHRTDVYSLGVTLYVLVTGQLPFKGTDLTKLLADVQEGRFQRPQAVRPQTPGALQAICLKAMQREPDDRYQTAVELAADIEAYLADEPVSAWREPFSVRLRRSVRRHQTAFAGTAAAVLVATLGLGLGLAVVSGENRQLREANGREVSAREEAQLNADRAQTNLEKAQQVVDEFFTEVSQSEELLRGTPGTQELRRKLLQKARAYYQAFIQDNQRSGLESELAQANERLGHVLQATGNLGTAEEAFQQNVDLLERLAEQFPGNAELQNNLSSGYHSLALLFAETGRTPRAIAMEERANAICRKLAATGPDGQSVEGNLAASYNSLGRLRYRAGQHAEAEKHYLQSVAILERLLARDPSASSGGNALAIAYGNLGRLYRDTGRVAEAEEMHRRELDIRRQQVKHKPDFPEHQSGLVGSYNNLGNLYMKTGKRDEAEQPYREALAVSEDLARENPTVIRYQRALAATHLNLTSLYMDTGNLTAAEQSQREALAVAQRLNEHYPSVPQFRNDLAGSQKGLGLLLQQTGKLKEATTVMEQSLAIMKQLVQDNPTISEYRLNLIATYNDCAKLHLLTGAPDAGRELFEKSFALGELLVKEQPQDGHIRHLHATACYNLGVTYDQQGRQRRANEMLQRAFATYRKLTAAQPDVSAFQHGLAEVQMTLAMRYADRGKQSDAQEAFLQALAIRERLVQEHPRVTDYLYGLAAVSLNLGINNVTTDPKEAERLLQQASKVGGQLVDKNPSIPKYQHLVSLAQSNLAALYGTRGNHLKAEEMYQDLVPLQEELVRENPVVLNYKTDVATTYANLGAIYINSKRHEKAIESLNRSLAILVPLERENASSQKCRVDLAETHHRLGAAHTAAGNVDKAEQAYKSAITIRENLSKQSPELDHLLKLGSSHQALGALYINSDRLDEAEPSLRRARSLYQQLAFLAPVPPVLNSLGLSLMNLGIHARKKKQFDASLQWLEQSEQVYRRVLQKAPDDRTAKANLRMTQVHKAHAHFKQAWPLATAPNPQQRNGKLALEHARRACELTQWQNLESLETLAAAYAELGDFANARQYQQRAVKMTVASDASRDRLELYEQNRPYRSP